MLLFHGDKDERARMIEQDMVPGGFDVIVTSYEMVVREAGAFRKFAWRYLIVDEVSPTLALTLTLTLALTFALTLTLALAPARTRRTA